MPLDLSHITLTREISQLGELLARNVHENWARLRIAGGWSWGPARDDLRQEHPNLVPFEQLPSLEREYDSQTALETIKTLLAMGYTIQAADVRNSSWPEPQPVSPKQSADYVEPLLDVGQCDHASLLRLWYGRNPDTWAANPELYSRFADRFLRLGEPLIAYDIVAEAIGTSPQNVHLRQQLGLSLARSGAVESANAILAELYQEGHRDEETLGLLARTHKDLARQTEDSSLADRHFREAYKFYSLAYETTGGYWSGINAATLALVLGESEDAVILARTVAAQCRIELSRSKETNPDRYWLLSTLGEAALLQGHWSQAEEWYAQVAEVGRGNWGSLQSTRHNAQLLLQYLDGDQGLVNRVFRFPSVVVFVGHMIDRPDRGNPRFPAALEEAVKDAIRGRLEEVDAGFGYAAAACGSDILFHEAILERNGESHVVLPYEREFFVEDSVDTVRNPDWKRRFDIVMSRATEMHQASKRSQLCGQVSYEFSNLILHGLASIRAEQLETKLIPMAVWDCKPGDGPGGTAATLQRWRNLGLATDIIDLTELASRQYPDVLSLPPPSPRAAPSTYCPSELDFAPKICALLFADAHGFSELSDEQVPRFVQHFLGLAGKLACDSPNKPLMKNTWGDGLYFVFANVRDAGQFALDLRDGVRNTDWAVTGLPDLDLRIGLHAGPVYSCIDPVTKGINYFGAHVSRAARIEPITPVGQVYASQAFAALAAAECVKEFRCNYVGRTSLAKKYGIFPTYVVLRRHLTARTA